MKLLRELNDELVGTGAHEELGAEYTLRKSARAILRNQDGLIAVQYLRNHHFHKLPGGGVDQGETVHDALIREVREEVGCEMQLGSEIGVVLEFRNKYKLVHLSYCYTATVLGEIGTPTLEAAEVAEGLETLWLPAEEALTKIVADTPSTYESHFILPRERAFLEEYVKGV